MKDWRYWWTMPVLLSASMLGPGQRLDAIADLPTGAAVPLAVLFVAAWAVLAFAAVIAALWAYDRATELIHDDGRPTHARR
ncbi:hypothetical protein BH11ACT6_BH11ACT6_34530 [soil metagenome]